MYRGGCGVAPGEWLNPCADDVVDFDVAKELLFGLDGFIGFEVLLALAVVDTGAGLSLPSAPASPASARPMSPNTCLIRTSGASLTAPTC